IRIAVEEVHDDFLPDTRHSVDAPFLPSHRMGDSNPTRALVVVFTLAVPMKLDFHAAILIDEYLLTRWTNNNGCLGATHLRHGRHARWPERCGMWNALKLIRVDLLAGRSIASQIVASLIRTVLDRSKDIGFVVEVAAVVAFQIKSKPRN